MKESGTSLMMRVMGIESSCDECSAAVVQDGATLLGQTVASQIAVHAPYGGVVPELASRDHIRSIVSVVDDTLRQAGLSLSDIDGFGVTAGPGLIGSLLVGVQMAKSLAWCLKKPLVAVNHLHAHLHAIFLEREVAYPHLGLVVSGGHTSTFRVDGLGKIRPIGQTLDDAAGEAFDKVAKLLGLGYPGGVAIEKASQGGDCNAIRFPRPLPGRNPNFSFSGLKTAVAVWVRNNGLPGKEQIADFAASFQEAVVDSLVKKTITAARKERLRRIVVSGGVAANRRLRDKMLRHAGQYEIETHFPSISLCTDNAAMVATLASELLRAGRNDGLDLDANAGLGWHPA